ncbi:MAG: glycosyltransferase [Actinomycetia bacterium]|nr:glycosyltransferase [Actinomycetes bacterium]
MKRWRANVTPVSVVVCTYNRRDRLEQTLVALREQTHPRFEVIVVNGPSTDGTDSMLTAFADRARIFDCAEASVGRARNVGVQHAAGDIVAFIDDDAIPRADWLAQMVKPFRDKRIGAVGGPVFDVPLDRFDWKICTSTRLGIVNVDSAAPIGMYHGVGADPFPYLAGCNVGHRRSALQKVGGFNADLPYVYEDTDVCCHLNDAGYRFAYVEQLQVSHYRDINSMRDGKQFIVDPYALALGRVVFAAHCQRSSAGVANVLELAGQWESEWTTHSAAHLESGRFTLQEHNRFVARAAAGTSEGVARGRKPRPFTTIGPPPIDEFRQYR